MPRPPGPAPLLDGATIDAGSLSWPMTMCVGRRPSWPVYGCIAGSKADARELRAVSHDH
jgi:hypothetical protein